MKIKPEILKSIWEDTALNDHCGALLIAARALECERLTTKIEWLVRDRDSAGGLDWKLSITYRECYLDLMQYAKENMSPTDYQQLYDSF